MKHLMLIFIGGGLGSIARYTLSKHLNPLLSTIPLGTFLSNTLASFLLGLLFALTDSKPGLASIIPPLLLIGFCGGFSTFSTFSYDNYLLLKTGNITSLVSNILLNLVVCLLAIFAGAKAGNLLFQNS